jgi:hypothetical protein
MREFRATTASALAHLSGSEIQKESVNTCRSLLVQAGSMERASDFEDKTAH